MPVARSLHKGHRAGAVRPILIVLFLAASILFGSLEVPAVQNQIQPDQEGDPGSLTYCYQGKLNASRLVVVDKKRQRLMVFRYLGRLELEYEYPCATGSRPGHKEKEGDERTPVGIYFSTHRYLDNKITIFGDRAIHLNFPNPFDVKDGRGGNGIFIHGTNQELKPRSSNGCIVLRNQDLAEVYPLIREQLTPVVVVESLRLADLEKRVAACDHLQSVEQAAIQPPKADMEPHLALRNRKGPNLPQQLVSLAVNLGSLHSASGASVNIRNQGLMLLGLGNRWLLVADQEIEGPARKTIQVTRRYYMEGDAPFKGSVLQGHWVLADAREARRLASWAPQTAGSEVKADAEEKAKPKPAVDPSVEIKAMVIAWLKAWQAKRLNHYMTYYAPDFKSGDMDLAAWRKQKRYLNKVYKVIKVRASNIKITVNDTQAVVTFVQHYRSDWHKDVGYKELKLVLKNGKWLIQSETWSEKPLEKAMNTPETPLTAACS